MAVELSTTNADLFENQMDWMYHRGIGMQTFKMRHSGEMRVILCQIGHDLEKKVYDHLRQNKLVVVEWIDQNLITMDWQRYKDRFEILEDLRLVLGQESFTTWSLHSRFSWPSNVPVNEESYERLALIDLLALYEVEPTNIPKYLFHPQVYRHWHILAEDEMIKRRLPKMKLCEPQDLWSNCSLFV